MASADVASAGKASVNKSKADGGPEAKFNMQKLDAKYPEYIGTSFASVLVFLMGAFMKADWILFMVYYWKWASTGDSSLPSSDDLLVMAGSDATNASAAAAALNGSLESTSEESWNEAVSAFVAQRFHDLWPYYLVPATVVSYLMFYGIGGFLHYWYYVRQRHLSSEWKCQPNHWLSWELELHEIVVGTFSLTIGSIISACMACWIMNGGYTTVYYHVNDYGLLWLVLQVPITFIWQDYLTYWAHRIYHMPFLYKHFHKLHHTYKHPTAFSVTAIHPVEFVSIQCIYISPMFLFPVHFVPYCAILMYTYYHGIIDHSGINFKRKWWQPWQPDCIFHDNHHQYFHVNFGFNIEFWDKLHGTVRRKDRIYHEDVFWGTGKALTEASEEELQQDLTERVNENPLAYAGNKMAYALSNQEVPVVAKKDQ